MVPALFIMDMPRAAGVAAVEGAEAAVGEGAEATAAFRPMSNR